MPYTQNVPAAERTLRLLETVAAAPQGLSAGELEAELNISRSSLFALLNTLKTRNYIEQTDNRGRYRAGPALLALAPTRQRGLAALLEAFYADTELGLFNETVALAQADGPDTVIVALHESKQTVRVVQEIGQRYPARATAAGHVLLAGLAGKSFHVQEQDNDVDLPSQLSQTRQEAIAQLHHPDRVELACPVCPDGQQVAAALSLSLPAFRWQPDLNLPQTLRAAAARLSYRLGASIYQPYGQTQPDTLGPTTPLQSKEIDAFLQQAWGARLACIRSDGTPHVVPLWYEWNGQHFWITASGNVSWAHYVRENAAVSLTVDEPWPPLRRVLVNGRARPMADEAINGGITGLRQRLVSRYLGQNTAPGSLSQVDWQAFCITPKKIIGQRGLGN